MFADKKMRAELEKKYADKKKADNANAIKLIMRQPIGLRRQPSDNTSAKISTPVKNQLTRIEALNQEKIPGIRYHSQKDIEDMRKKKLIMKSKIK
jgi:hypothetical protein